MRTYQGVRTDEGCEVTVNGDELSLRLDLRKHSPTGFEWGYSGSGPAQLALAILADHFRHEVHFPKQEADELALGLYQKFKARVIGGFSENTWRLTTDEILVAIQAIGGTAQA